MTSETVRHQNVNETSNTLSWQSWAGPAIFVVVVILVIPLVANNFWLRSLTSSAIFALAASGTALLYGRLGLVSLAQVALVGVGGWVALRLSYGTPLPFEIVVLGGGLAAGLIGFVIGLPALRMRGLYLALVTLMAAAGFQVVVNFTQFPNGGDGFIGRTVETRGLVAMDRPLLAQADAAYFRYVVIVAVLGFLLVEWNRRGRPGRAWAMIRKSEASAISAGVNVTFYKTWAFTLAGFLAGIAGGLLAGSLRQLDPRTFPASDSIMLFALTVVGGAYTWVGQVITGVLLRAVPTLLNDWGLDGNLSLIIFGVALLHALITAPEGLAGQFGDLIKGLFKRGGGS